MKFWVCNVVWGNAYVDSFLEYCIPSQLWPNNLPYIASRAPITYRIYTTLEDREKIISSPHYKRLANLMPVEFSDIEVCKAKYQNFDSKYGIMTACHVDFFKTAGAANDPMLILHPDGIWSDGSLKFLYDQAISGKRMVLIPALRTNKETLLPALNEALFDGNQLQPIRSRELVKLALNHKNDEVITCTWGGDFKSLTYSVSYWDVPNEGVVFRGLHLQMPMVNPASREIDGNTTIDDGYTASGMIESEDIYIVRDSDEFVVFEFTDSTQQNYSKTKGHRSYTEVADWARQWTGAHHRQYFRFPCRLRYSDFSPAWAQMEKQSEVLGRALLERAHNSSHQSKHLVKAISAIILTKDDEVLSADSIISEAICPGWSPLEILVNADARSQQQLDSVPAALDPTVKAISRSPQDESFLNACTKAALGDYLAIGSTTPTAISLRQLSTAVGRAITNDNRIRLGIVVPFFWSGGIREGYKTPDEIQFLIRQNSGTLPVLSAIFDRDTFVQGGGCPVSDPNLSLSYTALVSSLRFGAYLITDYSYLESFNYTASCSHEAVKLFDNISSQISYSDLQSKIISCGFFSNFGITLLEQLLNRNEPLTSKQLLLVLASVLKLRDVVAAEEQKNPSSINHYSPLITQLSELLKLISSWNDLLITGKSDNIETIYTEFRGVSAADLLSLMRFLGHPLPTLETPKPLISFEHEYLLRQAIILGIEKTACLRELLAVLSQENRLYELSTIAHLFEEKELAKLDILAYAQAWVEGRSTL